MTTSPPRSNGSQADELPQTLIDRVQARVTEAAHSLDRRANATRPKARRRQASPPLLATERSQSPQQTIEEQSLRRVFRELGVSYRRYRSQTGTPLTPGLRDAAYNFRAEPSLTTLVAVAAFLDELDLLS